MTLHLTAVAAKDGAGTSIPGGVNQHDTSGTGAGPNVPAVVQVDSSGAEVVPAKETGGNLATIAGAVSSSKMSTKAASGDFADGALATIGAKADAKSTATDTTPVSAMSVWKQISASIQALAALISGGKLPVTAFIDSSTVNANGQATSANSAPVVIASDQSAIPITVKDISNGEYETVAASQTDQVLGATGAAGDWLEGVLIVPATSAAGAVLVKDGSGSSITIFAGGGTTALPTLAPIYVPLGIKSTGGAWKVTTGANVSAIGIGNFT